MTIEGAFKTINNVDGKVMSNSLKANLKSIFLEAGYRYLVHLKNGSEMPETLTVALPNVVIQAQVLERLGIDAYTKESGGEQSTVISFPTKIFSLDEYQLLQILENGQNISSCASTPKTPFARR